MGILKCLTFQGLLLYILHTSMAFGTRNSISLQGVYTRSLELSLQHNIVTITYIYCTYYTLTTPTHALTSGYITKQ